MISPEQKSAKSSAPLDQIQDLAVGVYAFLHSNNDLQLGDLGIPGLRDIEGMGTRFRGSFRLKENVDVSASLMAKHYQTWDMLICLTQGCW